MKHDIVLTNGMILEVMENHLGTRVTCYEKTRKQPLVTIGVSYGDVTRLDIGPLLIQLVTHPFTDADMEVLANLHIPINLITGSGGTDGTGSTGGASYTVNREIKIWMVDLATRTIHPIQVAINSSYVDNAINTIRAFIGIAKEDAVAVINRSDGTWTAAKNGTDPNYYMQCRKCTYPWAMPRTNFNLGRDLIDFPIICPNPEILQDSGELCNSRGINITSYVAEGDYTAVEIQPSFLDTLVNKTYSPMRLYTNDGLI
jgi:hypothetical protein